MSEFLDLLKSFLDSGEETLALEIRQEKDVEDLTELGFEIKGAYGIASRDHVKSLVESHGKPIDFTRHWQDEAMRNIRKILHGVED